MEISVKQFAENNQKTPVRVRQLIACGKIIARRIGREFVIEETQLWPKPEKTGPKPKETKK